jgi:hypothetical protein
MNEKGALARIEKITVERRSVPAGAEPSVSANPANPDRSASLQVKRRDVLDKSGIAKDTALCSFQQQVVMIQKAEKRRALIQATPKRPPLA